METLNIQGRLTALSLTQDAFRRRLLAGGVDVTPPTVRNWIKGRTVPRADQLPALAAALELTDAEILSLVRGDA